MPWRLKNAVPGSRLGSEDDFLALIDRHFPNQGPGLVLGRGDDGAVMTCQGEMVVTMDLFLEDVHFRRDYFEPEEIGYKALAVNVSDVCAMGALPTAFTLGVCTPRNSTSQFWDRLLAGMARLAAQWDMLLVGGDLDRACSVGLNITTWGRPVVPGRYLRRAMVKPGDRLFAVGPLGLSRVGLSVLEDMGRFAMQEFPAATRAHLTPDLHPEATRLLAADQRVLGLMDVSDGLARDLPRFVGPNRGVSLNLDAQSIHPEIRAFAAPRGEDPTRLAVVGGEDYALLGACTAHDLAGLLDDIPGAYVVGTVGETPGVRLYGRLLAEEGFDHFR